MINKHYKKQIDRNPYLLGIIIGLVIGIFPLNQLFTDKITSINDVLLFLPRIIFNQVIECPLCEGVYFSVFILSVIAVFVYVLLALSITFILRKAKSTKKTKKNKWR